MKEVRDAPGWCINFPVERDLIALKAEVDKLEMKGTLIKIWKSANIFVLIGK